MASAAERATNGRMAPEMPQGMPPATDVPRLAEGIELLGEYPDSGYSQPPSLLRRRDGQIIQLSELLYRVVCRIDGSRDPAAIAKTVSDDLGRSLNADQVRYLIAAKLRPLGIVAAAGAMAALPRANPLLVLRARRTLLPVRASNIAAALLRPLFRLPAVLAVIGTVMAIDYWLFVVDRLRGGVEQLLRSPVDLLVVLGISLASAAFHECGHATGCRYGGARPGAIGVGIYLVWPSFFTNVTDSYRLSRAGRLRTDLGGLYFNLIFILGLAGIYAATSAEILLLAIVLIHLQMLEQLLPFVRFDGYFILSDLAGMPDLFARVGPILRSAVSKGRAEPGASGLKPHARIVVTGWVACVVPLIALGTGYFLLHIPQINRALWLSGTRQAQLASIAVTAHHYAMAAVDALGIGLLALSFAGSLYIVIGLSRRLTSLALRWAAGRAGRLIFLGAVGLTCAAALVTYWTMKGQFRGW